MSSDAYGVDPENLHKAKVYTLGNILARRLVRVPLFS